MSSVPKLKAEGSTTQLQEGSGSSSRYGVRWVVGIGGSSSQGQRRGLLVVGLLALDLFLLITGSPSVIMTLVAVTILAVFATGTNLLVGHAGLLSFGQAAFYGIGAYSMGILLEHGVSFGVAMLVSVAWGAIAAGVIGMVLLRTRSLYFALASLAVSQLGYTFAVSQYGLTGGNNGLFGVPLPNWVTGGGQAWFVTAIAIIAIGFTVLLERSSFGLLLRSSRENRSRLKTFGLSPLRYEMGAFVVAGAICSVAGCLAFINTGGATPDMAAWSESAIPVLAAVVGGRFSYSGPIIGAAIYEVIYNSLANGSSDWELIFGGVLIVIVLLAPEGVVALIGRVGRRFAFVGNSVRRDGSNGREVAKP